MKAFIQAPRSRQENPTVGPDVVGVLQEIFLSLGVPSNIEKSTLDNHQPLIASLPLPINTSIY
jgi:hypothetical protein